MAVEAAAGARSPGAREWFLAEWLPMHKARNPHGRFLAYEAAGPGVYDGWIWAFREAGATRAEMTEASARLQRETPTAGLLPEHHLPRLLAILATIQAPRRASEEAEARAARQAEAEALAAEEDQLREAWRQVPEDFREHYRAMVRAARPSAPPAWAEMLARAAWAADVAAGPGDAAALIEAWRSDEPEHRPAPRRRPLPTISAGPPPEPTAEELARAEEARRRALADLARLPQDQPRRVAI